MIKILILIVAAYLAYRWLAQPRRIASQETFEVEDDVYVEYEEVKKNE
jgi:hypothetical protein